MTNDAKLEHRLAAIMATDAVGYSKSGWRSPPSSSFGVTFPRRRGGYTVPTAQRKAAEVVQLRGRGVKPEEIAVKLGISRASVFRVLKAQRQAVS
jgi:DNA invertase Pin-like site-specific DNA recombinase